MQSAHRLIRPSTIEAAEAEIEIPPRRPDHDAAGARTILAHKLYLGLVDEGLRVQRVINRPPSAVGLGDPIGRIVGGEHQLVDCSSEVPGGVRHLVRPDARTRDEDTRISAIREPADPREPGPIRCCGTALRWVMCDGVPVLRDSFKPPARGRSPCGPPVRTCELRPSRAPDAPSACPDRPPDPWPLSLRSARNSLHTLVFHRRSYVIFTPLSPRWFDHPSPCIDAFRLRLHFPCCCWAGATPVDRTRVLDPMGI